MKIKKVFIFIIITAVATVSASFLLSGCSFLKCSTPVKKTEKTAEKTEKKAEVTQNGFDLSNVPKYSGQPSVEINDNDPGFTQEDLQKIKKLKNDDLSPLDRLGRCGTVFACVSRKTMPEGKRGSIGMIKPAGWKIAKYDFIDGKYLYNRCHLIGWQLTGENAEERNLITGTRYMNTEGMLPYENMVADYVEKTGESVAYRVSPVYKGEELLSRGVHIEAESIEDEGRSLSFNVYCYNVQPDVEIDYETGDSRLSEDTAAQSSSQQSSTSEVSRKYILNTNTKRYHLENCPSVSQMKDKNKRVFKGTKEEIETHGYKPCGNCHP